MAAPTSNVRGTFKDSTGALKVGAVITFKPTDTPKAMAGDIVTSFLVKRTTDSNGQIGYSPAVSLVSGFYLVVVSDVDAFTIYVPDDGGTYNLEDIRLAADPDPIRQTGIDPATILSGVNNTTTVEFTRSGDRNAVPKRFVVVADVQSNSAMLNVIDLIYALNPSEVIACGVNFSGLSSSIDSTIGYYFQKYIYPYSGSFGSGSQDGVNHFWHALSTVDWTGGSVSALGAYFAFPNNERYYKQSINSDVDLFVLSSASAETDGNTYTGVQGQWLQAQLAASTARWKIVFFRDIHAASVNSYSYSATDWPFASWGASCVIGAGAHIFEHFVKDNIPYFVVGTVRTSMDAIGTPITGSVFRYASFPGVFCFDVTDYSIKFKYITDAGAVAYSYELVGVGVGNVESTVKIGDGLRATSNGLQVDFGTADKQALSGSEYETLMRGRIMHVDSLPSVSEARQKPLLYRDTLIMVGNDPVDVYFFHPVLLDFVLLCRSSLGSYAYSPSPVSKLTAPILSPSSGQRGAVTISHTDPLATLYYTIGDFNNFTTIASGSKIYIPNTSKQVWIAAYAMRVGYRDSDIVRRYYTPA